jgi:hypothetical protein
VGWIVGRRPIDAKPLMKAVGSGGEHVRRTANPRRALETLRREKAKRPRKRGSAVHPLLRSPGCPSWSSARVASLALGPGPSVCRPPSVPGRSSGGVGLDFALREPRDQGGPLGTDGPSELEGRELAVPDPVAHLPLGQPEKFGDRGGPYSSRPAWSVVVSLIAAPSIQELPGSFAQGGSRIVKDYRG